MALDGVLGVLHIALAALDLALERRDLMLTGVEGLHTAVEGLLALGQRFLALGDAGLGRAHFLHALLVLLLHLLLVAQGLVLRLHRGFTSKRLCLLLGILHQAGRFAGSVLGR